jgi:hypothetical protein
VKRAAALCGAAFMALFAWTAAARIGYPFQLEWLEGAHALEAARVAQGGTLFARPSLEFAHLFYSPLYFYVSAAVSKLFGGGLAPLRAVSAAGSVAAFCFTHAIVKRETGDAFAAAAAAGLLAACYAATAAFFDLARVDALFLGLLMASLFAAGEKGTRSAAFAGALLGLAFLAKQTALVVLPGIAGGMMLSGRKKTDALVFAGASALPVLFFLACLPGEGKRWFVYYVFELPILCARTTAPGRVTDFWSGDLARTMPFALILAALFFSARGGVLKKRFYGPAAAAMVAASWVTRVHAGGYVNVLLPAYASLAVLAGFAIASPEKSRAKLAAALALAQFAALAYDPRPLVPSADDARRGEALVARLRAVDGEVFAPRQGYLLAMAGKNPYAHLATLDDVISGDPERGAAVTAEFRAAVDGKKFSMIVLPDDRWKEEIQRKYRPAEAYDAGSSKFWRELAMTRVYVPKD